MVRQIDIKRGLNIPIAGAPKQLIADGPAITTVALVGDDYVGMKPTMVVREGDPVKLGQVLFTDKKTPGVQFTSPASGTIQGVHRGAKRKFESVVIDVHGDEQLTFDSYADYNLARLDRGQVVEHLLRSGLWTALRSRPFSKVANPQRVADALFISAIDTNPLAADPSVVLQNQERPFTAGVQALSTLTEGPTYLCKAPDSVIPATDENCVTVVEFSGPHPAGLPGTHIHFLAPVDDSHSAWYVNYQDVVAIGHLFLTGSLSVDRVVSIAGPAANHPQLVRTRIGANLSELTAGQYESESSGTVRTISGSVLSGRRSEPLRNYLGRYHLQVSLLREGRERQLLGWMMPGRGKFSAKRAFASAVAAKGSRRFPMTTSTEGSPRAIVPIGAYEQVMPLEIIATPLLKALVTLDTEYAQDLGCLELDEEDLALCTFVCPGKHNYGPILRKNLTRIELEG